MTTTAQGMQMIREQRRADADLRHETATLLQDLADRIRAGQVRRWQIETVLPSLRMCAHILRGTPEGKRAAAYDPTADENQPVIVPRKGTK